MNDDAATGTRTGAGTDPPRGPRVGIDVGGTFTDVVLTLPGGGTAHHKEPSTPSDPALAVARGLSAATAAAGLSPSDVVDIAHGTTIGLNAIIQRRGARIALIVSRGHRDILEIGRSRMPSSFDLHAAKEEPLVPRERVIEVDARLDANGRVLRDPGDADLARAAEELSATGADAAAVVVLHGHTAPDYEADLTARLAALAPDVPLVSSAAVWPEVREYERTLVACMNAYIQPLMSGYFDRLEELLADLDVRAPIFITASNGGSLSLASARARPIETVLSGPAAGVTAAARLAQAAGTTDVVTFDMGGTSSDIAVTVGGAPEFAVNTTIGGMPLILPVVAVGAIGAGGGSVVRVDDFGLLKTGPDSAGADPGPIAYGRGGLRPTITDCYLVTGVIDPEEFLGGRMALDRDSAEAALAELARALDGVEGNRTARAIADGALRIATAGMAVELHKTLARRGLDPADFTLVPYGGAGPTHAALLAEEVGITDILVPASAATLCALGAVGADLRRDFARSLRRPLDPESAVAVRSVLDDLAERARSWLADQGGHEAGPVRLEASADLSYLGQAHELRVALGEGDDLSDLDAAVLAEALHTEHERLYGFRDTGAAIRVGTVRLAVVAPRPDPGGDRAVAATGAVEPRGHRTVTVHGRDVRAAVHDRAALGSGHSLAGPAVIVQDDSTVLVPPGWSAQVEPSGHLRLRSRS
ncbi:MULTISPECIES: hydantoinase/oxoprolinase family protein [unclassified Nocardiopsis]|uniref:hydantoinase/oxoprolinase family protein n=1 Tax=unclassified Nocardiopsis TaxID=2649073 RepID=UPI00066A1ED3|nr:MULTISPECIES: hydantoinase/oxoprolinase family protein [unclassified Nocardiopsis]MBQ1079750.1 hydantoinase/oxoprolinase family protein [Nocardiopsis sp. B62]